MSFDGTIEIRDLVLRVPGIDRSQARQLAHEVTRRLADELPRWDMRSVPAGLDVRLVVPKGSSPDELAALIAGQILRALR
jgi:hypothetical protein